jgi:flagellar protein FlaG
MSNDSLASVVLATRPVHGSGAPEKTEVRTASGNALPPNGRPAPRPVEAPPKVEVPKIDISRAIHNINTFLKENARGLRFQVDEASGRTIITVINPLNGEVVRQIPPQEVLNIARELKATGVLVNATA